MGIKSKNGNLIENLKFKGTWRSYQQRVLDELETHLDDKKLNVVAAPGAGKTTLGIEVMSRLEHNSLILAPTITIRNQWKQRIIEGFLPDDISPDEISLDIRNIMEVTVSTYQALHTIYKMPEEKKNFLNALKENNIQTLVLDEAHHLRTEWWETLSKLCEELDSTDFTVVSLTGTPPYDVSPEEWNNYHTLCGPVDAEISIPELVKNGDLCPHQDLIYFSNLSAEEEKTVFDFEKNRKEFFNYINKTPDFIYGIEASPFLNDMDKNYDLIFKNTNFTISLISYLLKNDSLSTHARVLAKFLDLNLEQIPEFDYETAQTLFNGILGEYEPYFKNVDLIKNKLRELKLINNKKVDFIGEIDFKKLFARSKNKLDAIFDITKQEYKISKKDLREVVLLDYIGKGDSEGLNIFSVFDRLYSQNIPLGILTGTLIVIPETAKDELYKILEERNTDKTKVLTTKFCNNYLRVETYGEIHIVSIITKLFEKGFMNVLIGTAALLGEGWDSPCVNTLIIASVVGSFMLSNQMRGRALRIDKNNPDKTSNIWHLASVTPYEDVESPDFQTIKKRFNTFEGISYKDNEIRNGIERLGKVIEKFDPENCKDLNNLMFKYAKEKNNLKEKWNQVFKKSEITEKNMTSQMYEIVETHFQPPEEIEYNNFLQKMVGDFTKRQKIKLSNKEQLMIANAVLKTLCDMEKIKTPYEDIEIKSYTDKNGNFCITLLNCQSNERNIFIKSFNEMFVLDNNTRYLLKITKKVKEKLYGIEIPVSRYLPVPEVIGLRQETVKLLKNNLKGEKPKVRKNLVKDSEESCLEKASDITEVNFDYKKITLGEYKEIIRKYLEYLNNKKILKKKYSDIEIKAYKKEFYYNSKHKYKERILLSFFNCSDYERNLIVNNLCELFAEVAPYPKNQIKTVLKTKEDDGIIYFIVPQSGEINYKFVSVFKEDDGTSKGGISSLNYKKILAISILVIMAFPFVGFLVGAVVIVALLLFLRTGINIIEVLFNLWNWLSGILKNIKEDPAEIIYYGVFYIFAVMFISFLFSLNANTIFWLLSPLILVIPLFVLYSFFGEKRAKNNTLISNKKMSILKRINNNIRRFIAKQKYQASLQKDTQIDIIFTKSDKNKQEVLKAKYNTYLHANTKRSRIWI